VLVMPDATHPPAPGPGPAPVLVAFDPPAPQSRITVAVRPLLVLPHLVALGAMVPAVLLIAVIGWFWALALGRLPIFASEILSGYIRWQTRVVAYLGLLTDAYPPFTLRDGPYPVRLTTDAGRLNRSAVAFRLVLVIPAVVAAATVALGCAGVLVVTWPTVVVTGRPPSWLHQGVAAAVRYQARLQGYLALVTSQYPWGLLGDPDVQSGMTGWQPDPPPPTGDPYWRLVLPAAAKNSVVLFLVLGVASVVAFNITSSLSRYHQLDSDEAATTHVENAYQTLAGAVLRYEGDTRSCAGTLQPLTCFTGAAQSVSGAFTVFVDQLRATTMPSSADASRRVLVSDGARAGSDFAELSASTSAGRYELIIETSNLPHLLNRFDQDYQALSTELNNLI
jgi:hypothetical protein